MLVLNVSYEAAGAEVNAEAVGWVKRRREPAETTDSMGFALLNPSYDFGSQILLKSPENSAVQKAPP
jgi:hypothetical protein